MMQLRSLLRNLLWEPLSWIFYCFFQPMRFKREVEVSSSVPLRFVRMCQLVLPLFLCVFLPALVVNGLFTLLFPQLFGNSLVNFPNQIFSAMGETLLVLFAAVLAGTLFGLVYGIAGGMAAVFWATATVNIHLQASESFLIVLCLVATVAGLTVGVAIGGASDITLRSRVETGVGSAVGLLSGIPPGILLGIVAGDLGWYAVTSWWNTSYYGKFVASLVGERPISAICGSAPTGSNMCAYKHWESWGRLLCDSYAMLAALRSPRDNGRYKRCASATWRESSRVFTRSQHTSSSPG